MPDTELNPPVPEMPPGFDKLPVEQQMIIKAYKGNPEMMGVYQSTKLVQLHDKIDKHDSRIISLEESRKKIKWTLAGAGTIIALFKAIIIAKWTKVFG